MFGKCKLELEQHTQQTAILCERKSTGMEQGKCHIPREPWQGKGEALLPRAVHVCQQ